MRGFVFLLIDFEKNELEIVLAKGYEAMSSVNLTLAEEGLESDNSSLQLIEQILAESE